MNEGTLLIISYFLIIYCSLLEDTDLRYDVGWFLIGLVLLNISINWIFLVRKVIKDTIIKAKLWYFRIKNWIKKRKSSQLPPVEIKISALDDKNDNQSQSIQDYDSKKSDVDYLQSSQKIGLIQKNNSLLITIDQIDHGFDTNDPEDNNTNNYNTDRSSTRALKKPEVKKKKPRKSAFGQNKITIRENHPRFVGLNKTIYTSNNLNPFDKTNTSIGKISDQNPKPQNNTVLRSAEVRNNSASNIKDYSKMKFDNYVKEATNQNKRYDNNDM